MANTSVVHGIERVPSKRGLDVDIDVGGPVGPPTIAPRPPKVDSNNNPVIVAALSERAGYLAIRRSDGNTYERKGGTVSWRNNNPGNLKFGDFAKACGAVGVGTNGHAIFPTIEVGREAQRKLLFAPEHRYDTMTLLQAIQTYAPVNDKKARNQPSTYAAYLVKKVQDLTLKTVLKDMTKEQQDQMLDAMQVYEGFESGSENLVMTK